MWRGYTPIVPALCRAVRRLVREFHCALAVPLHAVSLLEAQHMADCDAVEAERLLKDVAGAPSPPAWVKAALPAVRRRVEQGASPVLLKGLRARGLSRPRRLSSL